MGLLNTPPREGERTEQPRRAYGSCLHAPNWGLAILHQLRKDVGGLNRNAVETVVGDR